MPVYAEAPDTGRFQRRLLTLMFSERRLMTRLAVIALVSTLFGVATPYASRIAIDRALPDASPNLLLVVAIVSLLMVAHRAWAAWLQGTTAAHLQASVERGALTAALRALVRSDLASSREKDSGWMMATLRGTGASSQAYVAGFSTLLTGGLSTLMYGAILAEFSGTVAAVVLTANLGIALVSYLFARLEAKYMKVELDRSSDEQSRLHVLVGMLASLRGLFASERMGREWSLRVGETGQAGLSCARAGACRGAVISTGEQALSTGVMVWAVSECFSGALSIGSLIFLLAIASGLSSSVLAVTSVVVGFRALRPSLDRVNELLESESRSVSAVPNPVLTDDCIRFERVTLRYSAGSTPVLADHDWSVARGQTVHLQAPSGTGKTTLLRMVAGLLPPTQGRVTVFGVEAARARSLVLYVPQHCRLFEATIRENLELLSGASRTEIGRVSTLTGLDQLLKRLPMGAETPVSSGGRNLSSGQRQLIVLTAAFATSRPVLLLDEATSQIDLDTRRHCQWGALVRGRTVIRVEHG